MLRGAEKFSEPFPPLAVTLSKFYERGVSKKNVFNITPLACWSAFLKRYCVELCVSALLHVTDSEWPLQAPKDQEWKN